MYVYVSQYGNGVDGMHLSAGVAFASETGLPLAVHNSHAWMTDRQELDLEIGRRRRQI